MRRAVIGLVLLAGCPLSTGPSTGECQNDGDCAGNVCGRDDFCYPASELREVKTMWTIRGMTADPITCRGSSDLMIGFTGQTEESIAYAPVPCENGQWLMDKLPRTFTAVEPYTLHGYLTNRYLIDSQAVAPARTFGGFPAGTTYWGADAGLGWTEMFRVTVTGNSGTLVVTALGKSLNQFFGVTDPSGLISVQFVNLGVPPSGNNPGGSIGNYAFDNIVTATNQTSAPVPPPPPPYLSQTAKANLIALDSAPGARGTLEARGSASAVTLTLDVRGLPSITYDLVVNNTVVAYVVTTTKGGNAHYEFVTGALTFDVGILPLAFDPFGSRFELRAGGVIYMTGFLGGAAAGGNLPRMQ